MTTTKLSSLAVALAAFAMACADSTMPTRALVDAPSMTVTSESYTFPPGFPEGLGAGEVRVCKTANAPGTFRFTATTNGTGTLIADVDGGVAGNQFDITVGAAGDTVCVLAYHSPADLDLADIETVVISEPADISADWALVDIDTRQMLAASPAYTPAHLADVEAARQVTALVNSDMARIVTFENLFTPPTTGCTYTKGWYRNNGSSTVIAVDGRTIAQAQAIFAATPGKPGGVTFGGDNTLLNLYQQLLAALNNLGGDPLGGPDAVDDAIADALAGTGGTGLNITTTLTQTEMSDLIGTLSAFNEGTFAGWPHCDD